MTTSSSIDPSKLNPEEPGQVKPLENAPESLTAHKETARPDGFKSSQKDPNFLAQQFVKKPAQLGHKMPDHHPKSRGEGRPMQRHSPAKGDHYRLFLKEPALQKMKDSEVYRKLEGRGANPDRAEPFPRTFLSKLLSLRHQAHDRSNARRILRHELHLARLAKQKMGSGGEPGAFLQKAGKLLNKLGLSGFEKMLKEAAAGRRLVHNLPEGRKAAYAEKSGKDWIEFFKNAESLGSQKMTMLRKREALMDASFRGWLETPEEGKTMVADLNFKEGIKQSTEKFARVLFDNHDLLPADALKPGDTVEKDVLSREGDDFSFLKLVHKTDVLSGEAKEAAALGLMNQLRNPVSKESLERTEQALHEERRRRLALETVQRREEEHPQGPFSFAGLAWELKKNKDKAQGKPTLGIFITYSLSLIFILLIFYAIFKGL